MTIEEARKVIKEVLKRLNIDENDIVNAYMF